MNLKWSKVKIKYFSKPIIRVERVLDWIWILLVITIIATAIVALRRIF